MKYVKGEVEEICQEYSELKLMDVHGEVVYKATVPTVEVDELISSNKNIVKK